MDKTKGEDLHKAVRNQGNGADSNRNGRDGICGLFCCIYIRIRMKKYSAH